MFTLQEYIEGTGPDYQKIINRCRQKYVKMSKSVILRERVVIHEQLRSSLMSKNEVFRGLLDLTIPVAVKLVANASEAQGEIRLLSLLNPTMRNFIRFYGSFETADGRVAIVMSYM